MKAERSIGGASRYYVVRTNAGKYLLSLNFREVIALVATRDGHVHARWERRQSYGFVDYNMVAACDLYGIGEGTLWGLQREDWTWKPLITPARKRREPGPLRLTAHGRRVLDAVLEIPGVSVRAEAIAA